MRLDRVKKKLRGTLIHKAYSFLRYDLPILVAIRVYYSVKKGEFGKALKYLGDRLVGLISERPGHIAVDIVSCCNLRCPLCSVPPFLTKRESSFMSMERFRRIMSNVNVGTDICLVYAGEPFLNPHFFQMVQETSNRFYVSTITNGTLLNRNNIAKLVEGGLDFLQISFDGFSRDSFERYRVGASFDAVRRGILDLLKERRVRGNGLPFITITFLVNAYNENELEECREYFLKRGADRFFSKGINLNVHRRLDGRKEEDLKDWLPRKRDFSLYEERGGTTAFKDREGLCTTCLNPIIRCDGEVLICCHDIFNSVKIGNIMERDLKSLWFSAHYTKMRSLAKRRRLAVCRRCGK